jgi:S-formylglutathione hydrolase FrmB
MPDGGRGWYTNWWNGGKRGAPGWERYHLDELVPAVKRRYRIRQGRRWHALAGLSMGAEGAVLYATQRPGYFGSVASFSGPLSIQRAEWPEGMDTQGEDHQDVFGDPEEQEFYWTGHNPTALIHNLDHTRVYVASGDGTFTRPDEVDNPTGAVAEAELRRHAADFVKAAGDAHVAVTFEPHRGIHDWPYWRQDLANAVRWGFFKPAALHPPQWEFATVSQVSQAWGFRFRFAKPPATLIKFHRRGARMSASGAGTVTVRAPGGGKFTAKLPFNREIP